MAEKVAFGFKVEPDISTEIKAKIAELGLSGEEYILQSFAAFERNRKASTIENNGEIKQVEDLLLRVGEIFVGVCKSRQDTTKSKESLIDTHLNEIEELKVSFSEERKKFLEEIEEIKVSSIEKVKAAEQSRNEVAEQMKVLTTEFKKQSDIMTKTITDMQKEIDATKNQISTQSDFIAELKLQKEQLADVIAKNQNQIEQAEKTANEFTAYKASTAEQINLLNKTIMDSKIEAQKAIGEVEGHKQTYQIEIERLQEKHQLEIERMNNKSQIEIEKLRIEMQTLHQADVQKLHDKHNQQFTEMVQIFNNKIDKK